MNRLNLSEEVINNNLGSIYMYLSDNLVCKNCSHKLSDCPKKEHVGYQYSLDTSKKYFKFNLIQCPPRQTQNRILSNLIAFEDDPLQVYFKSQKLLDLLSKKDNLYLLKSVAKCVVYISKHLPDVNNFQKGLALFQINKTVYVDMLLSLAAYISCTKGYKVAYLDMNNLLELFKSKYVDKQNLGVNLLNKASNSNTLILYNLDQIPRYLSESIDNYLFPLLKNRNKFNKITYIDLGKYSSCNALFKKLFGNSIHSTEISKIIEDIFEDYTIADLS